MTVEIKKTEVSRQKEHICDTILRALPEWFGIESAIADYVRDTSSMAFWAAFDKDIPVGFVALKEHNAYTAEIYTMGILKDYHRQGIGRQLIQHCESFCTEKGIEYLTVKTLDESREDLSYAKTRSFYESVGFRPLEVFPLLWGKDNPCLFLAKYLA